MAARGSFFQPFYFDNNEGGCTDLFFLIKTPALFPERSLMDEVPSQNDQRRDGWSRYFSISPYKALTFRKQPAGSRRARRANLT